MIILNLKNIFFFRKNLKKSILIILILIPIALQKQLLSEFNQIKSDPENNTLNWKKFNLEEKDEKEIIWRRIKDSEDNLLPNLEVSNYHKLS